MASITTFSSDAYSKKNLKNPYNSPAFTVESNNHKVKNNDKPFDHSILWRDFHNSLKNRKRLINQLRQISTDDTTPSASLKRFLFEIRQLTLTIVEDLLEIEYLHQMKTSNKTVAEKYLANIPPISSFEALNDTIQLTTFAEIITELDDIPKIPNIKIFLPIDFPTTRNPFILGKTVDELAEMDIQPPESGNVEQEMKILELLRYKRASAALIKAEKQVNNKMPLSLKDIERLWYRMHEDFNVNILIRSVCTVLYNSTINAIEPGTELHYLSDITLNLQPDEFLTMLNSYQSGFPLHVNVQASIRRTLRDCSLSRLQDHSSSFLVEWLRVTLGNDCFPDEIYEIKSNNKSNNISNNNHEHNDSSNKAVDDDAELMKIINADCASDDESTSIIKKHRKKQLNYLDPIHSLERKKGNMNSIIEKRKGKFTQVDKDNDKKASKNDKEDLNSMRYELLKLQQELLRRGVLDPRHYHASSIDTNISLDDNDFKKVTTNSLSTKSYDDMLSSKIQVQLVVKPISWQGYNGTVELIYEPLKEIILGKILRVHTKETIQKFPSFKVGDKEMVLSVIFSKLTISRLTGITLEAIVDSNDSNRNLELNILINQLKNMLEEMKDENDGKSLNLVIPSIDRNVYTCKMSAGDVSVEIIITRNIECTALELMCIPLLISFSNSTSKHLSIGPVTLTIRDQELQVLLINQRGLYNLAMSKWSSLVIVSQWLTSRLCIKRVPVFDHSINSSLYNSKGITTKLITVQESKTKKNINVSSDMSIGTLSVSDDSIISDMASNTTIHSNTILNNRNNTSIEFTDYTNPQDYMKSDKEAVLLDVTLNRSVEITEEIQTLWKSKNVPNIIGSFCIIQACQERDMLNFDIKISIPRNLTKGINLSGVDDYNSLGGESFTSYKQSENRESMSNYADKYDYFSLNFSYHLTNVELLIFGANEMTTDEQKVNFGSGLGHRNHPSSFMWNILNRLKVVFKGSKSNPFSIECNAADHENWDVLFERRILREIRTISGGVMTMSVSAVGTELLFDSHPTDGSIYKSVGSKLLMEHEIKEIILEEGWPLSMLDWGRRSDIASRILEKMKVVQENMVHRLELYSYAESRILSIGVMSGSVFSNKEDKPLGNIEINQHMTLADVRAIISHELDQDLVPKAYRFMYKGNPCGSKQEKFRRAWETLPKLTLMYRFLKPGEVVPDDDEKEREKAKEGNERIAFLKAQRRLDKSLVPVPIPTLCKVQEDSNEVICFHDIRSIIEPGDVLRFGNVKARDYVVPLPVKSKKNKDNIDDTNPIKTFLIEPAFDMVNEEDKPFLGNYPLLPHEKGIFFTGPANKPKKMFFLQNTEDQCTITSLDSHPSISESKPLEIISSIDINPNVTTAEPDQVSVPFEQSSSMKPTREMIGNSWSDIWVWKCIPRSEDARPRWRQLYDNGAIPYSFTYQHRDDGPMFFRIQLKWRDLELLCRDSRCPDLSIHAQRINEMELLSTDYYTDIAFGQMCQWYPQFDEFIDFSKFMKLVKDTNMFPDIKRPSRQGQLENIFQKEVKMYGLADRYATYAGFCRILKEVALIRYPQAAANPFSDNPLRRRIFKKRGEPRVVNENLETANGVSNSSKVKMKSKIYTGPKTRALSPPKTTDSIYETKVYSRLIVNYLMILPEWAAAIWEDAKVSAMKKEAKTQCAASRIASAWRCSHQCFVYTMYRHAVIILQAHIRRRQTRAYVYGLFNQTIEDWIFRSRYICASKIQSIIRRFNMRCRHLRALKSIRDQQMTILRIKRERSKAAKAKLKKSILYRQIRCVSGIMTVIRVLRKDQRTYSKDYGILIEVYVPKYAEMFKFTIEEQLLRKYMEEVLNKKGLSANDLFDKNNIEQLISSRLVCQPSKRVNKPPKVLFSQQALGQKGTKIMTHGRRIGSDEFVCALYERASDITALCYHRQSCKMFECKIIISQLHEWVTSEYRLANNIAAHKQEDISPLLKPENKKTLYLFMINNIVVDKRRNKFQVFFSCQYEKSRKMEYILRIQSLFRVSITRRKLMNHLATYIFLVKADGYEGDHYYYLNTKTGETSWEKPKALLGKDLPPEPMHKWVRLWYHTDAEYYINPYSGKYTHLSVAKAGHIITSLAKNYLAKPYHLTVNLFKKGYQFDKTIKVLYEKVPNKLGNIVNYAIVSHAVHHNYPKAKKLYADALQLADASPLLVRAYAIFLIGNCEPPVLVNKEKAISIFKDANRKDPSVSKFTTAFNVFFKYACICDPNNCYNLLNLGLVYYYIYSNISIAEKLFRRALAIAPFDERVTQNWSYVKDMFVVRNGPYLSPTLLHDNKAINIQLVESEHNHDSNDEIHKALLLEHDNRLKKVHALKHVGLLLSQSREIPPDHPF